MMSLINLLIPFAKAASPAQDYVFSPHMFEEGGWEMMAGGGVLMLIFWILVIVGIIALARHLVKKTERGGKEKTALDILKERYARGEIGKEEYEDKKKDLAD